MDDLLWEAHRSDTSLNAGYITCNGVRINPPELDKHLHYTLALMLVAKHNEQLKTLADTNHKSPEEALNALSSLYESLQLRGSQGGRRIETVFAQYGRTL